MFHFTLCLLILTTLSLLQAPPLLVRLCARTHRHRVSTHPCLRPPTTRNARHMPNACPAPDTRLSCAVGTGHPPTHIAPRLVHARHMPWAQSTRPPCDDLITTHHTTPLPLGIILKLSRHKYLHSAPLGILHVPSVS
jgi:hypothetical protein